MHVQVRDVAFSFSASATIVRNLKTRKALLARAHAHLAEEHRPPRVELDAQRRDRKERRQQDEPDDRADEVERPLEEPATSPTGAASASPTSGTPSIVWSCAFVPSTSNSRGTMSIWTLQSWSSRITSSVCSSESVGERDHDAMRGVCANELGKVVGRADQLERPCSVGGRAVAAVDEADDLEAVLGMLADLAVEELRNIARADDDHVLDVGRVPPADYAGGRPEERDEHDSGQPEDDEPRQRSGAAGRRDA